MNSLDLQTMVSTIARICESEKRTDAVKVLRNCSVDIEQTGYDNWNGGTYIYAIHLGVSPEQYARISSSLGSIEQTVLKHAQALIRHRPDDHIGQVIIIPDPSMSRRGPFQMLTSDLRKEIEAQINLMVAVSTGGPKIQSVDPEYRTRRAKIQNGLEERELEDPNPFSSLWDWYGKWSGGDLPSYQSRRKFIFDLYAPLLSQVRAEEAGRTPVREVEPTGWDKVDRGLHEARERLSRATVEEQFQAVGLICREVLISLAQTVFDPQLHPTLDGVKASDTDAKRMLEAYIANTLSGSSNEASRRHAKASLDLANDLQHRRTAEFRHAALCVEATASVVNIIAIISGQRDP
jgi:hypothetical protein